MKEPIYYYPCIGAEPSDGSKHLVLALFNHGLFFYTGHKDEDGNVFWFFQGPARNFTTKFTTPDSFNDWLTEMPKIEDVVADLSWEFDVITPRSYESLKTLYEEALEEIEELRAHIREENHSLTGVY